VVEFKNILCPIDLSEASVRPVAYAAAFARWYQARLTVLHVVPTFDPMQMRSGLGDPVRIVQPMPREQVLDELRAALDVALAAEAEDTVTTIVDRALAMPADLTVLGTHGRSGFDRLLLGSTTE
jgi:nucleotide-binding universal stress UspA family protein